jgi:hypothetical protein
MYKKEEEKLIEYKNSYNQINVPLDLIDESIRTGFQKAKAEETKNPRKRIMVLSFMAAAILLELSFFPAWIVGEEKIRIK